MAKERATGAFEVLALDLEGTLVTNAVSLFVRPGLFGFLNRCQELFDRIVLFTAVTDHKVQEILRILVSEGSLPAWMETVEIVEWERPIKDLRFVKNTAPMRVLIVDDQEVYVHPDQKSNWVPIVPYELPDEEDRELDRVFSVLERMVGSGESPQ